MNQPTCKELGFCQALAECPLGDVHDLTECHLPCSSPSRKTYPFAPGVIQGAEEYGEPLGRMETLGWQLLILAFLVALIAVVGLAAVNLKGLLP